LGEDLAALAQDVAQRTAGDVLHHDVGLRDVGAVGRQLLAGVVDSDDRGVVQRRGRLRLTADPSREGMVAREVGARAPGGARPTRADVVALAPLAHATAAEELAGPVASAAAVAPVAAAVAVACVVAHPPCLPSASGSASRSSASGWVSGWVWVGCRVGCR